MNRHSKAGRRDRPSPSAGPRKYEHVIPSRDALLKHFEQAGRPLLLTELGAGLAITSAAHQRALEQRLKAMVRDGQLIRNRAREFCLTGHLELVSGRVMAHRDGYGFLRPDDGSADVYLSAREMQPLWNGDRVAARVSAGRNGGLEGHVVEILARARTELVGALRRERGIDYVIEEGDAQAEVLIARGQRGGAKPGDIVQVEILEQPTARSHAIGRVARILGGADQPGIGTEVAILTHGIPADWPDEVIAESAAMPATVPAAAKHGREDLRSLALVTIDGADAKDFDDAVYCEPRGNGWRLIVAIADVSHYVKLGSALDREARLRGTSVYFPDRVVPMLPEALSNGLCSLNPKVDRLCLVCEMSVSTNGQVARSRFYEGVMRSRARLTYPEAWALLDDAAARRKRPELARILKPLYGAYRALAAARSRRGALDFDFPETRIVLDAAGTVTAVCPRERLPSHKLIEECMIAANVEAARRIRKARIPSLYRVHEGPAAEKIDELFLFLRTFDIKLPAPGKLKPRDLSRIIEQLAGRPDAELIEMMILRSMNQAVYQPNNIGHFGLALDAYAHFTSPIRRYPDLLVHRALKWLSAHGTFKGFGYSMADMTQLGEQTSRAERRADEAVWDVEEQLKCAYMKAHIGERFNGIVSGVVPFGLFVRIPELGVDGLVHVSSLPRDYYHKEPSGAALRGERTGQRYRLTDRVCVRVANVNVDERKIDFVLDSEGAEAHGRPPETRRGPRRRGRLR